MKKCLAALFVVACKSPSVVTVSVLPPPASSAEAMPVSCIEASHHDADAAMKAAGLELCFRDAVVGSGEADGSGQAGFVALVHGHEVLWEFHLLGGPDAKGYGWSGNAKLLGARTTTVAGRMLITIRWEQRTGGWSSGAGGSTDIRDVMTAVCTTETPKCSFVEETERELTVTGATTRRDREAWKLDIGVDGFVTKTQTKRFTDDEERPPTRVKVF